MARWVEVRKRDEDGRLLCLARWCTSYWCRLRGLTFRRRLPRGKGLVLVEPAESRSGTAIHMFAVFFPIGVLWLDSRGKIVDRRLAKPWRVYLPAAPAQYIVEGSPEMLKWAEIGDVLEFVDARLG